MKLSAYLKINGINQRDFSKLSGVDPATVSRLCKGKHMPTPKTIKAVEKATKGKVTWVDLISQYVGDDNGSK